MVDGSVFSENVANHVAVKKLKPCAFYEVNKVSSSTVYFYVTSCSHFGGALTYLEVISNVR